MHKFRFFVFLVLCWSLTVPAWGRGCRADVVRQDKITKQRIEIWTQELSSTSFLGSLWKTSETTIIATVGRYGPINALNLEIHKEERSLQNALLESAYRGAAGKLIQIGFKNAPPLELTITDVKNDARVAGVLSAKAVTTVVLSAVLSNSDLARLREAFTSRFIDGIRVTLSGDVRIELAIDEDTAEELIDKFKCFYQSLDESGVSLVAAPATPEDARATGSIAGRYLRRGSDRDVADLRADGTFSLLQEGMSLEGTYQVVGDAITLSSPRIRGGQKGRLVGDTIVDPQGNVWEKKVEAPAASPITVDQILAMVNAKLPDDVIIRTIKASAVSFTLTPEILVQLKNGGATDAVIRSMNP